MEWHCHLGGGRHGGLYGGHRNKRLEEQLNDQGFVWLSYGSPYGENGFRLLKSKFVWYILVCE